MKIVGFKIGHYLSVLAIENKKNKFKLSKWEIDFIQRTWSYNKTGRKLTQRQNSFILEIYETRVLNLTSSRQLYKQRFYSKPTRKKLSKQESLQLKSRLKFL